MKIKRYEIEILADDTENKFSRSPARGALMHGLLMEQAGGDHLHEGTNSIRPYTQSIKPTQGNRWLWTVNLLDSERAKSISDWLEALPRQLFVKHYNLELLPVKCILSEDSKYSDLIEQSFLEEPEKFITVNFSSPTAFKRAGNGNYWLWPEPRLLAQSSLNRWNAFSDGGTFEDRELLEDIAQQVHVQSYDLRSVNVSMDGIAFCGSVGRVSMNIHRNKAVRQMFGLLCAYARYSGVGIKTAMGLGATDWSRKPTSRNTTNNHRILQRV